MNQIQIQLLQLVGNALFGFITDVELNSEIIEEAKIQAVQGLIDPEAYTVYAGNMQLTRAHANLCSLLGNIPFVILKGCASAYYYPQPQRRTMGDVDFFVEQKDLEKAEEILLHTGFEFDHETEKHRCFRKAEICYEMHSVINGAPKDNRVIQQMLDDTILTSRSVVFNNASVQIPDDFHNGLICLLHICRHLSNSEVGLRQLCDWACIVNHVENFETVFKEKFERAGLWTCARIFSLTAVKYLGLPYQNWMGEIDESLAELLIEEIMSAGNMGRKKSDYETEWFVDREGTDSRVKGILMSANQTTKKNWPVAKHFVLLYPVGWVFFSVRYVIRILSGKRRKIDFVEIGRQADKKNRLLTSLQLFKPEPN